MTILTPRPTYAPFEYEKAYKYWELQQQSHWIHSEISMASDINDWKINLNETEKNVIGHILKGFTQSEVFIQEYWGQMVGKWFKKPEIQMMAASFSSMESIHAVAYAYLNQSLGLEDFEAFLHEPTAKAKIDRLIGTKGKTKEEIAKSLAIFSAFNEGVNLFSSFAILLNFSRFNKMKGLGQIIAFSIKDESLHSDAGCWLFRTLISEFPEIMTDELKEEIYNAARLTVELEDNFISKAFENGTVEGIDAHDLKTFIRFRTNTKLGDLGLKKVWKNIDKDAVERMSWFDVLSSGVSHADFFASRVDTYSKGVVDFSTIWDEEIIVKGDDSNGS
jgi:ribonucleoside-diphosphate reductase beta chain